MVEGVILSANAALGLGAVLVALVVLLLLAFRRHGIALAVYLVYVGTLDGYLKLSTQSQAVTLIRTVLLLAIVVAALLQLSVDRRRLSPPKLTVLIAAFVAVALVQIASPYNPNFTKPIASLRQEIEFVPLFFLAFGVVREERQLQWFLLLLVGVAAANGIANLVQFNLTPAEFARWGPGYQQRIFGTADFSGRIFFDPNGQGQARTFGLGSDAGTGGLTGLFGACAALALLTRPQLSTTDFGAQRVRIAVLVSLPAVVLCVVLSQTRSIVIATALALVVQVALTVRRQALPLVLVGGITLLVGVFLISRITADNADALSRYTSIAPGNVIDTATQSRGASIALAPKYAFDYPFGAGIGNVGPATGFANAPGVKSALNGETQLNVTVLDLGVAGLAILLAVVFVVVRLFRRIPRLRQATEHAYLAALAAGFAGVVVLFLSFSPLTSSPGGPFFWASAGILVYWLASRRSANAL